MKGSATEHAIFVIERHFTVAPSTVFAAWSSAAAKQLWLRCDDAMVFEEFALDFRVGGRENNQVRVPGGEAHRFEGVYLDIVPDRRIIYAFGMYLGEKRLSASMATVLFEPKGAGTKMVFTEQIAFLDGYGEREARIRGTEVGLDNLVLSLREVPAPPQ
ncbi:MAG: SRPBCC family protein [Massilia sp.]